MLYSIEVRLQPETREEKLWYFWILYGRDDGIRYNQGFGWEKILEFSLSPGYTLVTNPMLSSGIV